MTLKNPIPLLRIIALIEGASLLVLLFGAMPLKYLAGMPAAVKIVGWAHGVLFVLLCVVLLYTWIACRWPLGRTLLVFLAALLPLGPFLLDRRMKRYADEQAAAPTAAPTVIRASSLCLSLRARLHSRPR